MTKERFFRSLALMVLMIVINSGNAWAWVQALPPANPSVSYLDADGQTPTINEYTLIYSDQTTAQTWTSGYYVVGADYNGDGVINGDDATYAKERSFATTFSFSNTVTLSEHAQVTLIIADGFSLSISSKDAEAGEFAAAAINEAATYADMYLTVTAQSLGGDAGKLSVTGGKGGAGNASIGKNGGAGASLTKLIVNAGKVTISGGQGGQGGIDDDKGKDGGEGGTALTANNLIVNNGTLILHGGKGGEGGNGDEGQGQTGVTKQGAMITMYQPTINNGVLIADGGATTGAFMASRGAILDGNGNTVTMYDLDGNALSYQNMAYKYDGAIAAHLANITPFDLVSVSSLGQQGGGVTFTVDGTTATKAWAGMTVTVSGVAVEGYYIAGFTSDQVTITDNTFVMPETAVTVTATYGKYDDRITVNTTTYPEGCTLESGKTYTAKPYEGHGGAVYVDNGGTLNTNGANFDGNAVTGNMNDGGAICNNYGTVNVSGGSFTSNSTIHDGGAIFNKGGTTNISGTDFTDNYTKVLGGAIGSSNGGTLDITASTFTGNTATTGGAIHTNCGSSGCVAILTDVAFYGNTSTGTESYEGGGAIMNFRGSVMTLSNVTFSGNTAAKVGGAIYNYSNGTINLTGLVDLQTATDTWVNEGYYSDYNHTELNSIVNWNLTSVTDPAQSKVCIKGFQWYSNLTTTYNAGTEVTKVLVTQNITVKAEGAQAGGQYVIATGDFDLTTLQTNNSTDFTVTDGTNNVNITVNGTAGIIGNQGYKLTIVESTEAGADQLVLTVINYDKRQEVSGTLTLEAGKTYTAAPYEGKGGAAYVDDNATLTGTDVTFADNAATGNDGYGSAIYGYSTAVINLDGDIVFSGNTAGNSGAISGSENTSMQKGTTFKFTGNSVRFINNVASQDAGAINLSRYNTLTVDSSAEFSGNKAGGSGGTIWTTGATITFNGTVDFSNNTAGANGGAICSEFYTVENIVTLNNTATFTGNSATGNGGAIYNDGGTVTINGETTFSANTATTNGGAIYNTGTVNLNSKTTFSGNTATLDGGAIYNAGTVNMADSVILETSADKIYNKGTLSWDLTGTKTGKLVGYQYLTNDAGNGGKLTITVKDSDKEGDSYVIATGNMSNLTGKDTFTLTGVDGQADVTLTVNGGIGIYNGQGYKLTTTGSGDNGKLVLSVVHDYTLVLKDGIAYKSTDNGKTLGNTVTLDGLTFADGIWTMKDFTFETSAATAVSVKSSSAVTITVTGDNVITGGDSSEGDTNGLYANKALTLQGSGTLTVTAGDVVYGNSYGIWGDESGLSVQGITLNECYRRKFSTSLLLRALCHQFCCQ